MKKREIIFEVCCVNVVMLCVVVIIKEWIVVLNKCFVNVSILWNYLKYLGNKIYVMLILFVGMNKFEFFCNF